MKKNPYLKYWLIFIGLVLACTLFLIYVDSYTGDHEVFSEKSPDGKYILTVTQAGYPQKPAGSTPFGLLFTDGEGKTLSNFYYFALTDGRLLTRDMIKVEWNEENFALSIGSESSYSQFFIDYTGSIYSYNSYSEN